ncbi:MAG: hypothetical protein ABS76_24845 [Pelagibacterium sp. SCN 64-44]|nr:MAG: hypothetical protein ABS76_24845 [Pelagibacterium sp. SCN 64-44]
MADYKELLRRAISALPENNGAARRAVYEKARSALVGQLRAIQPPLPARDITQHRLQLEDCIRQVEQEASEAVINLGRDAALAPRPPVSPPAPLKAEPAPAPAPVEAAAPPPEETPEAAPPAEPEAPVAIAAEPAPSEPAAKSIEDIIAEAAETAQVDVAPVTHIVSEAAPASGLTAEPANHSTSSPDPAPTRPALFSFRREETIAEPANIGAPIAAAPRIEPVLGSTALARQPAAEPVIIEPSLPVEPALSSIREVEVENDEARAAEGAIERAIETLDREARGEPAELLPERDAATADIANAERPDDSGFAAAGAETRSGAGLTIFLIVFVLLLAGVGGGGFWAWREGYVDLDQMFGRSQPAPEQTQTAEQTAMPTLDPETPNDAEGAAGPGNTATTTSSEPTSALEGLEPDERLEPTPEAVTPNGTESVLPSIGTGENKTEERLSGEETSIAANNDPAASVDPVNLAGNQSLLLEASADGQSGAVPFSGTVDWSEGVDEIGLPTLLAHASIPARNLGVSITIRKNSDPILPASHLMEIAFEVPDTFIGGSISTLAGVLLKDEELVPGTALKGAAARVVGNSFLFALSASPDDVTSNSGLLQARRWIDLAVIYGTGRNAILTLEKDEDAQVLFDRVLAAWAE